MDECPVCLDKPTSAVLIPCKHWLCKSCVLTLFQKTCDNGKSFFCPLCRGDVWKFKLHTKMPRDNTLHPDPNDTLPIQAIKARLEDRSFCDSFASCYKNHYRWKTEKKEYGKTIADRRNRSLSIFARLGLTWPDVLKDTLKRRHKDMAPYHCRCCFESILFIDSDCCLAPCCNRPMCKTCVVKLAEQEMKRIETFDSFNYVGLARCPVCGFRGKSESANLRAIKYQKPCPKTDATRLYPNEPNVICPDGGYLNSENILFLAVYWRVVLRLRPSISDINVGLYKWAVKVPRSGEDE